MTETKSPAINWRHGAFRLWAVTSGLWCAAAILWPLFNSDKDLMWLSPVTGTAHVKISNTETWARAITDAMRNLVENAVAHSPLAEEVTVSVFHDGRVSVADRGPGVPPADREVIFQRFWRGPSAKTGGAGLGLSIVKEIMRAHGGVVRVTDNPRGGALFTLSFIGRFE